MQACIPNIGPKQQSRRLARGAASLAVAIIAGAALAAADAGMAARALVILPLYIAALGFFQHREKT